MRDIRAFLLAAGASTDDIARAEDEGWLPLLAVDRLLVPGPARYDVAALAQATHLDEVRVRQLWRALGFPDLPAGVAVFGDDDLHALRRVLQRVGQDQADWNALLRQARVICASMARIATIDADLIARAIEDLRASGASEEEVAASVVEAIEWPSLAALLDYVHRVQARAAIWRHLARESFSDVGIAVGFVDLAGFTRLSVEVDASTLTDIVARWEELAYETTARFAGRVVKTIGDEVMVAGLPEGVARIAAAIVSEAAASPLLPSARGGCAAGPVIFRDGDYYGPVVNLASRLAELAAPGQVLVSEAMREQLRGVEGLAWGDLGDRAVRGMGRVRVFAIDGGG